MKAHIVTDEMVKEIAECMKIKMGCYLYSKNEYKENKRKNPFYSEFHGMVQMLKLLNIPFEFGFDDDYEIISITIDGYKVNVLE